MGEQTEYRQSDRLWTRLSGMSEHDQQNCLAKGIMCISLVFEVFTVSVLWLKVAQVNEDQHAENDVLTDRRVQRKYPILSKREYVNILVCISYHDMLP